MPFACAGYPTAPADLAAVRAETRSIALRLQKFPALMLWGGNNEVQVRVGYCFLSLSPVTVYLCFGDHLPPVTAPPTDP